MSGLLDSLGIEARTIRGAIVMPQPVTTDGEEEATRRLMADTLAQLREAEPLPPEPVVPKKRRFRIHITMGWEE